MPICKQCNNQFPNRYKQPNGRNSSLATRKFCLVCSPFGAHNTRATNPGAPRSDKAKPTERTRQAWQITADHAFKRAKAFRDELVQLSGGRCTQTECGYNRHNGSLVFHHVHPSTKLFSLAAGNLRSKSRNVVLEEWAKCVLVCSNCHGEIHDGVTIDGMSGYVVAG